MPFQSPRNNPVILQPDCTFGIFSSSTRNDEAASYCSRTPPLRRSSKKKRMRLTKPKSGAVRVSLLGVCRLRVGWRSSRAALRIRRRRAVGRGRALSRGWRGRRIGCCVFRGLLAFFDELDGIGDVLAAVLRALHGSGERRVRTGLVDEGLVLLGSLLQS